MNAGCAAGAVLRWGRGGAIAPKPEPSPKSLLTVAAVCSSKTIANSYTRGVFGGLELLIR